MSGADRFYFLAAFTLPMLKPGLARLRSKHKGAGKLKKLRIIMLVMHTVFLGGVKSMRKVSINGAVFIFMARGEKLKDSDALPSNGTPDKKYVLWPRGEGWDVRSLLFGEKGIEWLPIAEHLFADESEAWQAAYGHWMDKWNSWG
ncbi:hypothetical protein ACCW94_21545 [Enterobacter soli]|uniref:hypothetical protein n=1 Tax=Enterobacter TaxID=547 RepID=UPI0022EC5C22|nr:hypothetical protein [Enterobacter hormaechei]WBT22615.1 hypothetical protein PF325_18060 [Enterobacter hormaechei]